MLLGTKEDEIGIIAMFSQITLLRISIKLILK